MRIYDFAELLKNKIQYYNGCNLKIFTIYNNLFIYNTNFKLISYN